jgi:hypothetical protein
MIIYDIFAISAFFASLVFLNSRWSPKKHKNLCRPKQMQYLNTPLSYQALCKAEQQLRLQITTTTTTTSNATNTV